MQYPNEIQAALLFDRKVSDLEAMVRSFIRVEEARSGARFNVPEAKPGIFYRLFGGGEMMITLEYLDHPADPAVFQQTLASTITGIMCPDIRERLMKSRSHILVNVSHGVMGNALSGSPDIMKFLEQINYRKEGHSLPELTRRLEVCALISDRRRSCRAAGGSLDAEQPAHPGRSVRCAGDDGRAEPVAHPPLSVRQR